MDGEHLGFTGQVFGRMAKRLPAAANLTDVYQWFHRRAERLVGEMVRLAKANGNTRFFDQVYGWAKLLPIPGKVTDLYQAFERRSQRLVRGWLTLANENGDNLRKTARRSDEDKRHPRK